MGEKEKWPFQRVIQPLFGQRRTGPRFLRRPAKSCLIGRSGRKLHALAAAEPCILDGHFYPHRYLRPSGQLRKGSVAEAVRAVPKAIIGADGTG